MNLRLTTERVMRLRRLRSDLAVRKASEITRIWKPLIAAWYKLTTGILPKDEAIINKLIEEDKTFRFNK